MLDAELISDPSRLEGLAAAWDELAVASASPFSTPAWMLGAWRHLTPSSAQLRAVAVRDGGRLVALAPLYADYTRRARVDYRLLGDAAPRAGPIAAPGREWEAGRAVAAALAQAEPRPDVVAFEGTQLGSLWPVALSQQWPGAVRPLLRQYLVKASPVISLVGGSFDAWLSDKSSNFRSEIRRLRRRIADAGGKVRASTPATLADDIAALMRLHASRWSGKGHSSIVEQQAELAAMFAEVGAAQLGDGRFRLLLLELDGEPISAQLFAAAGGEVVYLNGGWDERHERLKPAQMCIVAAVEDAFARGEQRFDLGPGEQHYKRRLADGNDPVAWTMLVVPRPRMPLTLARVSATVARIAGREAAKRALTAEQADRLRTARGALSRHRRP